jgi:hypothetical protein
MPMFTKLICFLPDFILDPIYDAIFAEFVRRGNIILPDELNNHDYN